MTYSFNAVDHIHELDGKPLKGASTVVGVLSKPLTYWAAGLACEKFGWTNGKKQVNGKYITIPLEKRVAVVAPVLERIKTMNEEQFLALGDEAYKAHAQKLKDSAGSGTDMHAQLEEYVKNCLATGGTPLQYTGSFEPVRIFSEWAVANVKRFIYSESHGYSQKLWVGGISDCGVEFKDGSFGIIDFKSSKDAYTSQFIQIALYDIMLTENGLLDSKGEKKGEWLGANTYVVFPFGMEVPKPQIRYDVDKYRRGAEAVSFIYDLVNDTVFNSVK